MCRVGGVTELMRFALPYKKHNGKILVNDCPVCDRFVYVSNQLKRDE